MSRSGVGNAVVGDWGERIVAAFAQDLVGEPVRRVGVGRGGRESVDLESAHYAIEVKTLLVGVEAKIKPSARSVRQKVAYAAAVGKRPLSILVLLDPGRWQVQAYRRPAFGAFRKGAMEWVGEWDVRDILRPRVP